MKNTIIHLSFPILLGLAVGGAAIAQVAVGSPVSTSKPVATTKTLINSGMLPPDVRAYARAIGSRLTVAGLEQTTIAGTYTDKSGTTPLTLVWQNPGKVQVTLQSAVATVLTYNGPTATTTKAAAATTAVNQDLLETMTDDYPDSFFFNLAGAGYRFLGARFRTDDGKTPNYTGPYYDICQKVGPVPSSQATNQKLYYFDSHTGLLSMVQYKTGGVPVTVTFSGWKITNGQSTPGTIVRSINGVTEFTINLGAPALAAAGSNSVFSAQ